MKLTTPLKTQPQSIEQRIFKLNLFVVLPLLAAVTVYLFVTLSSQKDAFAEDAIRIQGRNANKQIAIFFDPISRDIGYLQTLGNAGQLDPAQATKARDTIEQFSASHLQHVHRVILWEGEISVVFAVSQGKCTIGEALTSPAHTRFLEKTRQQSDPNKIDWDEGPYESSLFAAKVFYNPQSGKPCTIAMSIDGADFFAGLKGPMEHRLFLVSDRPDLLPRQFLFEGNKPDIRETNDPVILNAFTEWKGNDARQPETLFPLLFDGKTWWGSICLLKIKDTKVYSGLIVAEAQILAEFIQGRRHLAIISLISFVVVLIATALLWRRHRQDIAQGALPPALRNMDDDTLLQAIAAGEGDRLEFKSTLRWNLRSNKPDKAMEIACLKTIAAFLNSDGGTLLVGVEDNGHILGIEADQFPNEDKFLLHFNNLINQHLGLESAGSFSFKIRHFKAGDILVVDCLPSSAPVYLTHNNTEDFYIRVGTGTRPLSTSEALDYIRSHYRAI